ncbi:DarT ssDNA thymidine ADP-ribosyltransferase family protein [Dyadobacter sediminis]|nr:DarT ssDNA thymidine ADP-ribosyltransferase family protein [Dyadobacter sediminis]
MEKSLVQEICTNLLRNMDNVVVPYSSFSFTWIVKSTSYEIFYRKAFDVEVTDEIFCTIISRRGNRTSISELGKILGFNLQDLAEADIFNTYLSGILEYDLIKIDQDSVELTEQGQHALTDKLKFKYFCAKTELFQNQVVKEDVADFCFRKVFNFENKLSYKPNARSESVNNIDLKQRLQFQVFENDIYKGEIVDLLDGTSETNYKDVTVRCEIFLRNDSFQFEFYESDIIKPEIEAIINLPNNEDLKDRLLRKGMYHYVLKSKNLISAQDIIAYVDLWDWKELAGNPRVAWNDKEVFEMFRMYGDGGSWSIISKLAPVESIVSVIREYTDYWNWTELTQRVDSEFIKLYCEWIQWDFEEISYKDEEVVTSLLLMPTLKNRDWDWSYLSKNLPDDFIEEYIDDFPWDFYLITEFKSHVLRNLFLKGQKSNFEYAKTLLAKPWNWKFISNKFDIKFLYDQTLLLGVKFDWPIILQRFFGDKEITNKCLEDHTFRSALKKNLPLNFVVAHQKYFWTIGLIDFFENENLIQWDSASFINGFDTNVYVDWDNDIFMRYHGRIKTSKGYFNVSNRITDYGLIERFPNFCWNWIGISKNEHLIKNVDFIRNSFLGRLSYSNYLNWSDILINSTLGVEFWNQHLDSFFISTDSLRQVDFWKELTKLQTENFVLSNTRYPWDWDFVTENISSSTIAKSLNSEVLLEKFNWEIATRKIDRVTILDRMEYLSPFLDWKYLINDLFSVESELVLGREFERIVACIASLNHKLRAELWKYLTRIYAFDVLFHYVELTYDLESYDWDWDFLSGHKYFPTDMGSLHKYKHRINWSVLSGSQLVIQKFSRDTWNSNKEWLVNINGYLRSFRTYWDWSVLSRHKSISTNRNLIKKFRSENLDWEYLTEFGGFLLPEKGDGDTYLQEVISQLPGIKFELLSKREDIIISRDLIVSTKNKNWDWKTLSENRNADISAELLFDLIDKDWDWHAISRRTNLFYSNEMILRSLNLDLDWKYLSSSENVDFTEEFINTTKLKPWNWFIVSQHKSFVPSYRILSQTSEFDLDWKYISNHSRLEVSSQLLDKFEDTLHWDYVTRNIDVEFLEMDLIERFAHRWDWNFLCQNSKIQMSQIILDKFSQYLDWDLISSNPNIDFSKEMIGKFRTSWNWTLLKNNLGVVEKVGTYVRDEIAQSGILTFLDKIEQQWSEWKGSIYHFTHIENAVEIIKNRKIQSRNKATILADAAGSVVHLRGEAHNFARFYFRPQTPTQFYNEFLGKSVGDGYNKKNTGWVSWYEKARSLGFPKCPIPIFFRFSLKEVLFKNGSNCCVSNGNMQTSATLFGSIDKMLNKFGFDDLYFTPEQYATRDDYARYRDYAQQEFLVKDELAFDDLIDFEIVCPSNADKILLINLLGASHVDILPKIVVDPNYYNHDNSRVNVEERDLKLYITSGFDGDGYFVLSGVRDINDIEIFSGNVIKLEGDKIIFKSNLSIGNFQKGINLSFIDESGRSWYVYSN